MIEKAASVVNLRSIGDYTMGDVGCALISSGGKLFTGVCIDVGSSMGFCAEYNAVGSMITEGEYQIEKIVAVWKDEAGDVFVLSPCGRCREFMIQVDAANGDTEVLLGADESAKLIELLPRAKSFTRVE